MRKWIVAAVVGLLGLATVAVWAGSDRHGLRRYSTSEGVSRLASGCTHFQADQLNAVSAKAAKSKINLTADSTAYIWKTGASGGRHGEIVRYTDFHVAAWKLLMLGITAAADGPCSLFVFCGGISGDVDSGRVKVCEDTLVYPFNGASMNNSGAAGDLSETDWLPINMDSVVFAPQDSVQAINAYAVGDTF